MARRKKPGLSDKLYIWRVQRQFDKLLNKYGPLQKGVSTKIKPSENPFIHAELYNTEDRFHFVTINYTLPRSNPRHTAVELYVKSLLDNNGLHDVTVTTPRWKDYDDYCVGFLSRTCMFLSTKGTGRKILELLQESGEYKTRFARNGVISFFDTEIAFDNEEDFVRFIIDTLIPLATMVNEN